MVGIKAKRSIQDEKLIEAIFESNSMGAAVSDQNLIIDARPLGNAVANRAMGAGFESTENYRNCRRKFMGIDNIHVIRDSFHKLLEVDDQDQAVDKWLSGLEGSQWLRHIRTILESAQIIVDSIRSGNNTLIHCSDGWDRTAQLSALASICLDPYYRTLEGFQVLVEKEWISFGHKFNDRCGLIARHPRQSSTSVTGGSSSTLSPSSLQPSSKDLKEMAPIFLQFIECVAHLIRHHPAAFEFNTFLLRQLVEHVYACQFGTFIGNCEQERSDAMRQLTSFWSFVFENPDDFTSPVYEPPSTVRLPPSDEDVDDSILNVAMSPSTATISDMNATDAPPVLLSTDEVVLSIPLAPFHVRYSQEIWDRFDDGGLEVTAWQPEHVLLAMRELDCRLEAEEALLEAALHSTIPTVNESTTPTQSFRMYDRQAHCQCCKGMFFASDMQWQCTECQQVVCTNCSRHRSTPDRFRQIPPHVNKSGGWRVCDVCAQKLDGLESQ